MRHSWVSTACAHIPPAETETVIFLYDSKTVSTDPFMHTEKITWSSTGTIKTPLSSYITWEKAAGAHCQSFVNEAHRAGCNYTRMSSGRLDVHLGRHCVHVRSVVSKSDASRTLAPHPAPVAFPSRVCGHLHLHLLLLLLSVGLSQTHSMISLSVVLNTNILTHHTLTINMMKNSFITDWLQERFYHLVSILSQLN